MRYSIFLLAVLLPGYLVHPDSASGQIGHDHAGFYVVAEYDEAGDPALDLATTVTRAQAEGKRILLQVGGEWCGWCKLLDQFIRDHDTISQKLETGFLIMKVNWSRDNHNEAFLGQYPAIQGYPHIYVLEKDGTFLHSQDTVELEEGRSYNQDAITAFLDKWMPSPPGV